MAGLHIKKDDTVVVISGKDKGKEGKVLKCQPTEGKVLVEGVNMLTLIRSPANRQTSAASFTRRALSALLT